MGFNLVKALSRAVGLPDKVGIPLISVLAPPLVITDVAVNLGMSAVSNLTHHPSPQQSLDAPVQYFNLPTSPGSTANYYPQYTVASSGFSDYSTPSSYPSPYNEVPPWDYSTQYSAPIPAPTPLMYPQSYQPSVQTSPLSSTLDSLLPVLATAFL